MEAFEQINRRYSEAEWALKFRCAEEREKLAHIADRDLRESMVLLACRSEAEELARVEGDLREANAVLGERWVVAHERLTALRSPQ